MPKVASDKSWMKKKRASTAAGAADSIEVQLKPSDSSAPVATSVSSSSAAYSTNGHSRQAKKNTADNLMGKAGMRESRLGNKVGKRLGSRHLHWLKNNWVLVALSIFALIGVLAAIIIAATPCPDVITRLQKERKKINSVVKIESRTQCAVPNVEGTVPAECPTGTTPVKEEICGASTCLDPSSGKPIPGKTNLDECPKTNIPKGPNCTAVDGCYSIAVQTRCTTSYACANNGNGSQEEMACGDLTVEVCETTTGQVDQCGLSVANSNASRCSTSQSVLPSDSGGKCPAVSLCTYCVASNDLDGSKLYEYPDDGGVRGCGSGRVKFVSRLDQQQGSTGTEKCPAATRETTRTVDMDGMILLDTSGSVSNSEWDLMIDVGVKVIETFGNNVGPNTNHLKMGALPWASSVRSTAIASLSSNLSSVETRLGGWKGDGRPFEGGTQFGNPLANCASQVRYGQESSSANNAYRMCMLVSDGANFANGDTCSGDDTGNVASCAEVCPKFSLVAGKSFTEPDSCTAENLAWELKTSANVSIVSACVGCPTNADFRASKNVYCHSDCNRGTKSIETCISNLADKTPAQLEAQCPHFIDASKFSDLELKLVNLASNIGSSLETETVAIPGNAHSPVPAAGSVKAVAQKTSRAAPAVTEASSSNQTATITDTTNVTACKDNRSWLLLLFFLPLLFYLLYFPLKLRADAKKAHLRHLLVERKLLAKMKADEIRNQVAAQQAEIDRQKKGSSSGGGAKKKYKWDIKAADQYLWASSKGGGAMKVDFGKMGAPASAPKGHHSNKVLTLKDGTVLKGEAAEKAIKEMKEEEAKEARLRYEKEIALAEELERAGKLEEGGEFWLRLCPCCKDIMVAEDGEDVFELEHHDVEKGRNMRVGKTGGMHQRGESLFKDVQTHNSSNPAVTYGA